MIIKSIKEMQDCNIEMLQSFDALCRKHGLSYSLAYGVILGYVRDKHLIPWDDDIDVFMFRDDYEKLRKIPKDQFDPDYELVTPYDLDYFFDFVPRYICKRYSAESADVFDQDHKPIVENIRMDIFILDNSFEDRRHKSQIRKLIFTYLQATRFRKHTLDRPLRIRLLKWFVGLTAMGKTLPKILDKYERISLECKEKTSLIYMSDGLPAVIEDHFPREWFEDPEEVMFYGIRTFVPHNLETLLELWFGNYKELPPEEDRVPKHFRLEMD